MPGTAVSVNFSKDKAQSCLYVGDLDSETIYILNRNSLEQLGRLGSAGRMAGNFHWLHQVAIDSRSNIYTGEVDTGKRVQKFVHYGENGCSGWGFPTVGGPGRSLIGSYPSRPGAPAPGCRTGSAAPRRRSSGSAGRRPDGWSSRAAGPAPHAAWGRPSRGSRAGL